MIQDKSVFNTPQRGMGAEPSSSPDLPSPSPSSSLSPDTDTVTAQGTRYRKFSTHDFKTHFSRILRDMQSGHFDAAIITSYDRNVGVFFPHPDTEKS